MEDKISIMLKKVMIMVTKIIMDKVCHQQPMILNNILQPTISSNITSNTMDSLIPNPQIKLKELISSSLKLLKDKLSPQPILKVRINNYQLEIINNSTTKIITLSTMLITGNIHQELLIRQVTINSHKGLMNNNLELRQILNKCRHKMRKKRRNNLINSQDSDEDGTC